MPALRTLLVCSLAVITACAAPSPARTTETQQWRELQRQRLRGLVRSEQSDLAAAGRIATDAAAAAGPQDPVRHIDQRRPEARRDVQPPRADSQYVVGVGAGVGTLRVELEGTRLDDRGNAVAGSAWIEPSYDLRFGPGFRLEAIGTEPGLFGDELMNDGQQVERADATATWLDAFPHLQWQLHRDRTFRLPLRVGAFVDDLRLQHGNTEVRRRWYGYGVRAELEPTWRLLDEGGVRLDLHALAGADFGGARFREIYVGGSDSDTTRRLMGELGVGLEVGTGAFTGQIGYRYRLVDFGETRTALLGTVRTDVDSSVLFVDAGLRF